MIRFGKSGIVLTFVIAISILTPLAFAGDYSLDFALETRGGSSSSSANYQMEGAITFNTPMPNQSSANYQTTNVFDIQNATAGVDLWMLY